MSLNTRLPNPNCFSVKCDSIKKIYTEQWIYLMSIKHIPVENKQTLNHFSKTLFLCDSANTEEVCPILKTEVLELST